jgi:hypothetical protein
MWGFHYSDQNIQPWYTGLATILATGIVAGVAYLVLTRQGWVRWLFVLFVSLGLVRFAQSVGNNALGDWTFIEFVVFSCDIVIVALVFTPSANLWFRAGYKRTV